MGKGFEKAKALYDIFYKHTNELFFSSSGSDGKAELQKVVEEYLTHYRDKEQYIKLPFIEINEEDENALIGSLDVNRDMSSRMKSHKFFYLDPILWSNAYSFGSDGPALGGLSRQDKSQFTQVQHQESIGYWTWYLFLFDFGATKENEDIALLMNCFKNSKNLSQMAKAIEEEMTRIDNE